MRLLSIILFSQLVLAEASVTVLGVSFPVDKFEVVDEESVVVTINGVSRLLSKDKVDAWVVEHALGAIKSPRDLGDFTKRAKASGRIDWALKAIQTLCDEKVVLPGKDIIVRDVISELRDFKDYPKKLDPECAKEIILNPSLTPPEEVSVLYKLAGAVKEEAEKRVAQGIIEGKSSQSLIDRMLELYGETDIEVSALRNNYLQVNRLKDAITRGSFSEAEQLVLELKNTGFSVAINEILHEQAKSSNNPGRSLQILSLAISTRPSTFEILDQAISNLSKDDIPVFTSDRVLKFASQNEKLVFKLKSLTTEALSSNSFLEAEEGIKALISISSKDGEKLALKMMEKQRALGLFTEANRTATLISRKLTFLERLRLFLLSDGWLLGLTGLSLAILLTLLRIRRKKKVIKVKIQENNDTPKFVTMGRATGFDRRKDEYGTLLEFFGLSGQVTEREIKNAFRKKIKEVHPDLVEGQDQDFLKTKESYERLLELHNAFNRG